jgi:hypothetical protein
MNEVIERGEAIPTEEMAELFLKHGLALGLMASPKWLRR